MFGFCFHGHFITGGSEDRIESTLPPVRSLIPTKPWPAGVWSLLNLPEAGKPEAGWGRVGEGNAGANLMHAFSMLAPDFADASSGLQGPP